MVYRKNDSHQKNRDKIFDFHLKNQDFFKVFTFKN